jgi:hypothetical protein
MVEVTWFDELVKTTILLNKVKKMEFDFIFQIWP